MEIEAFRIHETERGISPCPVVAGWDEFQRTKHHYTTVFHFSISAVSTGSLNNPKVKRSYRSSIPEENQDQTPASTT